MKRKRKLNLIDLLLSTFAIIVASFCTYNIIMNGLYSFNGDTIFKSSDNCKNDKDLYIAEMKIKPQNNTTSIIEEAKKNSCKK